MTAWGRLTAGAVWVTTHREGISMIGQATALGTIAKQVSRLADQSRLSVLTYPLRLGSGRTRRAP